MIVHRRPFRSGVRLVRLFVHPHRDDLAAYRAGDVFDHRERDVIVADVLELEVEGFFTAGFQRLGHAPCTSQPSLGSQAGGGNAGSPSPDLRYFTSPSSMGPL